MIQRAKIEDVKEIARVINKHAEKGVMLPISWHQINGQLRDFVVVVKKNKVIGCGAVHVAWDDLGEIRSVAIDKRHQKKGSGTKLIEALIKMAKEIGLTKLFVLTYKPDFFKKFGFEIAEKSTLPHKIWTDCLNCPKFPNCDEIAMTLELK